jgi:hypothetical protein
MIAAISSFFFLISLGLLAYASTLAFGWFLT